MDYTYSAECALISNAEREPAVAIDTTPNTNVNVSQWKNFTDAEQRFSVQYPAHWAVTQGIDSLRNYPWLPMMLMAQLLRCSLNYQLMYSREVNHSTQMN